MLVFSAREMVLLMDIRLSRPTMQALLDRGWSSRAVALWLDTIQSN